MILKTFSPSQPRLCLQELTNKTKLPKTTVLRLLKTLIALRYIQFNVSTKQYYLGSEAMSLGFTVLWSMDLREAALPYLEELSMASQQNVGLSILDGTDAVYIERIKKIPLLGIDLHVGARLKVYHSAMGRAILAFLEEGKFKAILDKVLADKDTAKIVGRNGKVLSSMLQEVRKRGWALSEHELFPGMLAIAAPVFNEAGAVEGAINMPLIAGVVSKEEMIQKYVPMLVDAAKKISSARGYQEEMTHTGWNTLPLQRTAQN